MCRAERITDLGYGVDNRLNTWNRLSVDARDRLTRITQSGTGVAPKRVDYSYDDAGRDLNSSGTTLVRYVYGYDAADRTTSESRLWASGSATDSVTYAYTDSEASKAESRERVRTRSRPRAVSTARHGRR